jgi:alpha-beta hydrolase superfamily lysophospholipase
MSLRHALIGVLADEPRTGYGLLKHFEQSLAYAWPASHSQIYPELARLRAPVFYAAAEDDQAGLFRFAQTGQALYDATASADKTLELIPGGAHGIALITGPTRLRGLVETWLRAH